jgi:mono/diheme cytochrome c family protein
MIRLSAAVAAVTLAAAGSAFAQSPAQRGDYLVNSILNCGGCHTPRGPAGADKPFAGGNVFETPGFKVFTSNLTPDKETGLGNWTAEQIKNAIMKGVRPDGTALAVMPTGYYTVLTPRDADAIVAYLRSLKPIRNQVPTPEYKVTLKPDLTPPPLSKISRKARRGYYLATVGHCMECHSPREKGVSQMPTEMGVGRHDFKGPWGVSTSRNITSDKEKGLGAWSDAEIKRAITTGVSRNGDKLKPPMGYAAYAKMTDKDMGDLIAYLRTVPAKQ